MYFAPPIDYDRAMRLVPKGKLTIITDIRSYFARENGADFTEPITAGIFVSIAAWASHGASMAVFLSAGMLEGLQAELLKGAYTPATPAALVYKATWPEEKVVRCTVGTLAESGRTHQISKTALVLVGDFLEPNYQRSKLYDPSFTTGFREASQ